MFKLSGNVEIANPLNDSTCSTGCYHLRDFFMVEEIWKPVIGYDGYEVSDKGRVRNSRTLLVLKQRLDSFGYPQIPLRRKCPKVHKLVCRAFLGEPNGLEVDHINGDKTDNNLSNLRYLEPYLNATRYFREQNRVMGVYKSGNKKKPYRARIRVMGKNINLGNFKTEFEAFTHYAAACVYYQRPAPKYPGLPE